MNILVGVNGADIILDDVFEGAFSFFIFMVKLSFIEELYAFRGTGARFLAVPFIDVRLDRLFYIPVWVSIVDEGLGYTFYFSIITSARYQ